MSLPFPRQFAGTRLPPYTEAFRRTTGGLTLSDPHPRRPIPVGAVEMAPPDVTRSDVQCRGTARPVPRLPVLFARGILRPDVADHRLIRVPPVVVRQLEAFHADHAGYAQQIAFRIEFGNELDAPALPREQIEIAVVSTLEHVTLQLLLVASLPG